MTVVVNPYALAWKHDNAPGIRCAENEAGQMILVEWPESLGAWPTQAQADTWASEYASADVDAIAADLSTLKARGAELALVVVRLVQDLKNQGIIQPQNYTAKAKAAYLDFLPIADRLDPPA